VIDRALPALLLGCVGWLGSGCCVAPTYQVIEADARAELEHRERFAVLGATLEDPAAWAYARPASAAHVHSGSYRSTLLGDEVTGVADPAGAPPALAEALDQVQRALIERGYLLAAEGQAPDLVAAVGLTHDATGLLTRVSLDVGGALDGTFQPDLLSLEARPPRGPDAEDACVTTQAELLDVLLSVVPDYVPPSEREERDP
jgi:hypothetical protein